MTYGDIITALSSGDYDLNKLVEEVKAEKAKQKEKDEWNQHVAEAQEWLLASLVDYVEAIFGEALTKEEVEGFQKGSRLSSLRSGYRRKRMRIFLKPLQRCCNIQHLFLFI